MRYWNNMTKDILDALAISTGVAVLAKLIPIAAGALSMVWLGIRIHDRIKYGPSGKGD